METFGILLCSTQPMTISTILSAFLLIVFSGTDDAVVTSHLRAGDAFYRAQNNDAALQEYLAAEKKAPNDYEVLIRLIRIYNDMGRLLLRTSGDSEANYRTSIGYAERLHQHYPDRADTYFWLALCHGSLTPFKSLGEKLELSRDVRANAERAIAIDSSFTMAYVILGIYYRGVAHLSWVERTLVNGILGKNLEGTLEDSERMFKKALQLEPENSFVHFEWSRTLRDMDRPDEAKAALERVRDLPVMNAREARQQADAVRSLQRMNTPR
jgi:tetratricopeptide (TPR) repeat protein